MYIRHLFNTFNCVPRVFMTPVSVYVSLYVSLCYICACIPALSSECSHATKGRQKTAIVSQIPQGLKLFDVASLTL